MKLGSKFKRRRGYTLLEIMIATALTGIVLAGLTHWIGIVRTNWQDASEINALVQSRRTLNVQFVRGGFGYESGLQSAVPPVQLIDDGIYGINIIYHNYSNEYYAIQIEDSGEVYQRHQNSATPWWDGGFSKSRRVGKDLLMKQVDARLERDTLTLDYVLDINVSGRFDESKPKRFVWTFRRY